MTTMTSECYDGTSISSMLTTDHTGKPVVNVEITDGLGEVVYTHDVPMPPNAANPEDWLAFEHREVWRERNADQRRLT